MGTPAHAAQALERLTSLWRARAARDVVLTVMERAAAAAGPMADAACECAEGEGIEDEEEEGEEGVRIQCLDSSIYATGYS